MDIFRQVQPVSRRSQLTKWILFAVLVLLWYGLARPAYVQANDKLDDYKRRLDQAASVLQEAKDNACCQSNGEPDSQILAHGYQQAYQLAVTESTVELRPSQTIQELWPLLDPAIFNALELGDYVPELANEVDSAQARLQITINQLEAMTNDRTTDRLALLDVVLARPEFQEQVTLWQRFTRWFSRLWDEFFPASEGSGTTLGWLAPIVGWGVAIIAALVTIVLLSYWMQQLLGSFARHAQIDNESVVNGEPITAQQAREQASQQAESGNYRGAIRRLYLAALLTMEERGTIRHDRSKTNREMLAQVLDDEAISSHLNPIVETFDDVWYGIREPDHKTYSDYSHDVEQLTSVANQGQPEAESRWR